MDKTLEEAVKAFLPTEQDKEKLSWDKDKGVGFFPVTDPWYEDIYFQASVANSKSKIAEALNKFRVDIANRYIKGKILDFGCGCGQFIEYRGNAVGFDICPRAIENLREKGTYLDFWNGGMDDAEIEGITMFDVLEHLRDPSLVLSQIKCRWLIISVPIFENKEKALASRHFKPREHFWYFSHKAIFSLLDENGFEMVDVRDDETRIGRAEIQTYVFRKKRTKPLGKKCSSCFSQRKDFDPGVDGLYVCQEELEIFKCVSLCSDTSLCFWDSPSFELLNKEEVCDASSQ